MTQKKFVGWSVRPIRRTTIWKNMIHIVRSQFVDAVTPSDHIIAPPQRLQKRRFVCSRPQCGHRVSLVSGALEDGLFLFLSSDLVPLCVSALVRLYRPSRISLYSLLSDQFMISRARTMLNW